MFWFGDRRREHSDEAVVIHPDDLAGSHATDLQRLLRRLASEDAYTDRVLITATDEEWMAEDGAPVEPVSFSLEGNQLVVDITYQSDLYEDEGAPAAHVALVEPVLARSGFVVAAWAVDPYSATKPWIWRLALRCPTRGRSLRDLFDLGSEVLMLLEAASAGSLTRESVAGLVRGGQLRALVGQPEGHWLDVKSQHYDLTGTAGRIALAQSVARFANAEDGGVVVVGMTTKAVPGGEIIRKVTAVPLQAGMDRRYQQVCDERIFPPVFGLAVEQVPIEGGMVMLIEVPPQPEELKPFLVHGAIVDGRAEGTFISIVRRRGEASIPITAPMIHAQLAAGRALLRGESPPSRP
ncbi:hypothetical protein SAMN05660199_01152 [Klenkia soli]|uniref:DNA-binding domain-containing protein n=1 Tax=Klenkia soli TaxID=1052260 RepID=A0A1H0G6A5_9ACTN|nr:ATP-binding protein [Klenkia soli]SDO02418.1 hypothetical protein SAMN05660199_01152 [Klenkia soli]